MVVLSLQPSVANGRNVLRLAHVRVELLIIALAFIMTSISCNREALSPKAVSTTARESQNAAFYWLLFDGRPACLIVANRRIHESQRHSSQSTEGSVTLELAHANGSVVSMKCSYFDNSLVVNGARFSLEKGRLFLVDLLTREPTVQLERKIPFPPTSAGPYDPADFKNDGTIQDFLESSKPR